MGFADLLRREITGLVDLLLPRACPLCGVELDSSVDADFCTACREGFVALAPPCCSCCALPFATEAGADHLCENCLRAPPPFSWVGALGLYAGSLRKAVHDFKFRAAVDLDKPLARLLAHSLKDKFSAFSPHLLIPVPLHHLRLRERTYNQSLLLSRRLARIWDVPVDPSTLERILPTLPQQGLNARERRKNLRGAFALNRPLAGQRVLLVDDVVTTATTIRECSRALRNGGASAVAVAVLARAERHPL